MIKTTKIEPVVITTGAEVATSGAKVDADQAVLADGDKLLSAEKAQSITNHDHGTKRVSFRPLVKQNRQPAPNRLLLRGWHHDLNNALAVAYGNLQMHLESKGVQDSDDWQQKTMEALNKAIAINQHCHKHLAGHRINQLFNLNSLLAQLSAEHLASKLENCRLEVRMNGDFNLVGDKMMLEIVFANLYRNAIEALPQGGKICVKVFATCFWPEEKENGDLTGRYLIISFQDNGQGILPKNLGEIFKEGFSTKNENRGIGLAYCRQDHGRINRWSRHHFCSFSTIS